MNIVFMGTPNFAVASLEALLESRHTIAAVVTAPDKQAGRGRKLQQSAVKQFAQKHGLPILQPTNLKEETFIEKLHSLKPDLQVVVAFRMLPKAVWMLPKYGTINLHASLLPDYRGAAPINWAIINGEGKSGATTFFINEHIDTGDLIDQVEVPISETDTAGDLHNKLMEKGASLVVDTVNKIENGEVQGRKQRLAGKEKPAPKIFKEDMRLDLQQPMEETYNKIRGLSPYPGAFALLVVGEEELVFKIYKAQKYSQKASGPAGSFEQISKKTLLLNLKNGQLALETVQVEGKKRMSIIDFLNGNILKEGAKLL